MGRSHQLRREPLLDDDELRDDEDEDDEDGDDEELLEDESLPELLLQLEFDELLQLDELLELLLPSQQRQPNVKYKRHTTLRPRSIVSIRATRRRSMTQTN